MEAAKLRHRVTFQVQPPEKGSLGSYEEEWVDVFTVWAQISPVSGKEYFSQVKENTVTHKIYCRYREDISPALRIRFGERYFRIISVLNWEERNTGLTIMCEELVKLEPSEALLKALKEQIEEGL